MKNNIKYCQRLKPPIRQMLKNDLDKKNSLIYITINFRKKKMMDIN